MITFERSSDGGVYACKTGRLALQAVANLEKKVPRAWINAAGNGVEQAFIDYVLPLIQGAPELPLDSSLPRFARLKFVRAQA